MLKNFFNYFFKFTSILILFLFIFSYSAYPSDRIDKLIIKGIDYCYHFNWQKAEDIFQKIIKENPDDPRGYHYQSSIYLWYYLSNGNEENFNQFEKYSDITLDKCDEILSEESENETALYIIGANYNYRAIAYSRAENFLDAAWASKKSESFLTDLLEINPDRYDAYLGLGLYNFAVAQIPSGFRWALSIAGIDGDKKTGIKYIKLAAEKGNFARIEAKYYLSQILSEFLVDYDAATEQLKYLVNRYPENLIFNYAYAVVEIKKRELSSAEKLLKKLVNKENPDFKQVISFSNFLMGDVLYRKNQFDDAIEFYKRFIDNTPDNDYTGIASYRLAICYELTGQTDLSKKYFELTNYGNMDIDEDIFARRKGNIYHENQIDSVELKLIKAANMIENKKYGAAFDSLTFFIDSVKIENDDLIAEANFYLSEITYQTGNYQESLDYALRALTYEINTEKWLIPYSNYYAARAHYKLGNLDTAGNLLDEAEDTNEYDFQKKIKNLIFTLENKLN